MGRAVGQAASLYPEGGVPAGGRGSCSLGAATSDSSLDRLVHGSSPWGLAQSEAERHDRLLCQISGNQGELVQRRLQVSTILAAIMSAGVIRLVFRALVL